jgi:hypothetical protein
LGILAKIVSLLKFPSSFTSLPSGNRSLPASIELRRTNFTPIVGQGRSSMSPILYLAVALVGSTPLDVDTSTHSMAPTPIVQHVHPLQAALGAPVDGWVSTQPSQEHVLKSDTHESDAFRQETSVADVFQQEAHWAENQQPAFLHLRHNSQRQRSGRIVRAQNQTPPYDDESPQVTSDLDQPILLPPVTGQQWVPPGGPTWGGSPNGTPIGSQFGTAGARPFRFGSQWKMDVGYIPKERTSSSVGNLGHLSIFEINTELRHTAPTRSQYIWSVAPQFNVRSYNSNFPTTATRFPNDTYRFGTDFQLTSPNFGGYTTELGFTPSFNTDFEQNMTSDSWSWDGRAALFFRSSPAYTVVLGAMYWDRVDDRVLPWAGFVFTPNDRMEIRAVFPKPEISWFMGTPWGVPQWWYVAAEYHVEAYQVEVNQPGLATDRMELEDWRVMMGIRSETMGYSSFIEAGWVFGREVEYLKATTPSGFDISSGFIARFGLRF